jgi:hypothetical protein
MEVLMRILDDDRDSVINSVTLMLTGNEAMSLRNSIDKILAHGNRGDLQYVDDDEFKHQIAIAIYENKPGSPHYFDQFSERTQKLILEDR